MVYLSDYYASKGGESVAKASSPWSDALGITSKANSPGSNSKNTDDKFRLIAAAYSTDKDTITAACHDAVWKVYCEVNNRGGESWGTRMAAYLAECKNDGTDLQRVMVKICVYIAKSFLAGKRNCNAFQAF